MLDEEQIAEHASATDAIANAWLQDLLQSLSTLCQHHEANRRQLLTQPDHATLKLILGALDSPEAPVSCEKQSQFSRSEEDCVCPKVSVMSLNSQAEQSRRSSQHQKATELLMLAGLGCRHVMSWLLSA